MESLKRRLDTRPAGTTTIDAIRDFISSIEPPNEAARLRKQIVSSNPALHMRMRARHAQLEPLLAESVARDLGTGPDDVRPLLVAAAMNAAFMTVSDRLFDAEAGGDGISHKEAMRILDLVLDFLRGGFEALQHE
jgi:hypothetical protein